MTKQHTAQSKRSKTEQLESKAGHIRAVLKAINCISKLIARDTDRECVMQKTCELLTSTGGYLTAWAFLIDNDGNFRTALGAGNTKVLPMLTHSIKQHDYPPCVSHATKGDKRFIFYPAVVDQHRDCPLFDNCAGKTTLIGRLESTSRVCGVLGVNILLQRAIDADEDSLFENVVGCISYSLTQIEAREGHKQIEQSLHQSEEKFRNLFHNAQVGLFRTRISNGKVLECNDLFARLLGYENRRHCISECIASERWSDPNERRRMLTEIQQNGKVAQFVSQIMRRNGTLFWMSFSARIYPERGCIEGALIDITSLKQATEELEISRKQLRDLSARLLHAREEERRHIAREIHDELGQVLTVLKMDLAWVRKRLPERQKSLTEKIESMLKLTDVTTQTVRRISTKLRPGILDDLGLVAAVEWEAEQFQDATGIRCEVTSSTEDFRINQNLATAIFRIFQETSTNILRHANATKVKVNLKQQANTFELRIRDNGKGITQKQISDPKSLGLIGIRERVRYWAGEVSISGIPGKGTTVTIRIPLHKGR